MTDSLLEQLATSAGIVTEWVDAHGQHQTVPAHIQRGLLRSLGYRVDTDEQIHESLQQQKRADAEHSLPRLITGEEGEPVALGAAVSAGTPYQISLCATAQADESFNEIIDGVLQQDLLLPPLRPGYHQLEINNRRHTLAIAPQACPSPAQLSGRPDARLWGLTAQLYALRRPGGLGVGDTGALEDLAKSAAAHGADAVAISPVHAVSAADFRHFSPYSPSSRLFFNVFHAAPDLILGPEALQQAIEQTQLREALHDLESLTLVDWSAIHDTLSTLFRQLFSNFLGQQHPLLEDFQQFVQHGGVALEDHCRYEAIHQHRLHKHNESSWLAWPAALQDPESADVAEFAAEHRDDINFHAFCQWLSVRSLQRAQQSACDAGMCIGLISDLAVGANIGGSQTWTRKAEFFSGVGIGAPPDLINTHGQNWQLAAFSPKGLQENGFRAYIEMLRANLSYCGGIRIDHVMGLERLWLIPDGASADQGAYVQYPFKDMLRLLTLEAWRHGALVIGEDLGTVQPGLRKALSKRNVLGMRVLFFERQEQEFTPSKQWPANAMATTTTHDLPSLQGWFLGRDILWRSKSGYLTDDQAGTEYAQREWEIGALGERLCREGYLDGSEQSSTARIDACISFVAATPSQLVMMPLEDLMGSEEQPNLPGPGNIHPNWKRRWPVPAGRMFDNKDVRRRAQLLNESRAGVGEIGHD